MMMYESMPLYPSLRPCGEPESCVRVPVFEDGRGIPGFPPMPEPCRRVTIENPCRPGERAEVLLSVDSCGNLVVCVRREPRQDCDCRPPRPCLPEPCPPPCPPRPCRPQPRCGRGRLYGTW